MTSLRTLFALPLLLLPNTIWSKQPRKKKPSFRHKSTPKLSFTPRAIPPALATGVGLAALNSRSRRSSFSHSLARRESLESLSRAYYLSLAREETPQKLEGPDLAYSLDSEGDYGSLEALLARLRPPEVAEVVAKNDDEGCTLLHRVAGKGQWKLLKVLLGAGADVHAEDSQNETALFHATRAEDPQSIDVLVAAGADPNHKNKDGDTIAHVAVDEQLSEGLAAVLNIKGIDLTLTDERGHTAHRLLEAKKSHYETKRKSRVLYQRSMSVSPPPRPPLGFCYTQMEAAFQEHSGSSVSMS